MSQYAIHADVEAFEASRVLFEALVGELAGSGCARATHAELQDVLTVRSRELFGQLLQDHLDLRAQREQRLPEVADAERVTRGGVETGHARALTTVFGQVRVSRLAYRRRGRVNLYPADGQLNLPVEKHSHGLRRLAAKEYLMADGDVVEFRHGANTTRTRSPLKSARPDPQARVQPSLQGSLKRRC